MPGTTVPEHHAPTTTGTSGRPRLGITYDLFGTGKTILKLSGSMYGDFMGTGSAAYLFNPYGAAGCWMYFWWNDLNGDGKVQANELFGNDPTTYAPIPLIVNGAVNPTSSTTTQFSQWGGFTPGSSAPVASPYTVDPNATSSRTYELLSTVDHEIMTDFSLALNATYGSTTTSAGMTPITPMARIGDYSIDGQNVALGPNASLPAGTIPIVHHLHQ